MGSSECGERVLFLVEYGRELNGLAGVRKETFDKTSENEEAVNQSRREERAAFCLLEHP